MKTREKITAAALVAAVVTTSTPVPTQAQDATDLPPAAALMTRFVDALGGAEAIRAHSSTHVKGRFEIPAQGIGGPLEILAAAPNMFLLTLEIQGIGTVRTGYDGATGWSIHPAMGPMLLDGRMLDQLRQEADYYSVLHPERQFVSSETVAREEFGGRSCYKVRVATHWGETYHQYFDAETGLLAGSVRQQATPMGDIETVTVVSDYKPMGGTLVATKIVQRAMGMEQVMTLTEAAFDTVEQSAFALPAEIETLVGEPQ